jgi:hypothetical protein
VPVDIELATNQDDSLRIGINDTSTLSQERFQLYGFASRRMHHFVFAATRNQDQFTSPQITTTYKPSQIKEAIEHAQPGGKVLLRSIVVIDPPICIPSTPPFVDSEAVRQGIRTRGGWASSESPVFLEPRRAQIES